MAQNTDTVYTKEYQEAYGLAMQALAKGQYDEALKDLDDAEKAQPGLMNTQNLRGAALVRLKKLDEAKKVFQAICDRNPEDESAIFNLAEISFLGGEYPGSKKLFQSYLARKGQNQNALALYKIFLCDLMTNNQPEVKQTLSSLVPAVNNPFYYFAFAADAFKKGADGAARDYLKSASQIYPAALNASFADSLVSIGYLKPEDIGSVGLIDQSYLQSLKQPGKVIRNEGDPQQVDVSGLDSLLPKSGYDKKDEPAKQQGK
ncbi:MAG: tetratricopeptide repeat protein [Methylacidiphilales bacterium]|nr:tetratricopeptide repeat protein [Candidatus Methylacidiphilales bacterium]